MATKTLRVFAEYTSTGFVPMPTAGNIDYGYTLGSTFPVTTPTSFQTDNPDLVVTVTAMTDFYVWIRVNGQAWNPSYTRNVRVYPDSPNINNVVMNMIIATGPAGVSSYTQIVQTSNRLYFNGATTDSVYDSKFAGKTYINELNFGTAPQLSTVATSGAYADLTGKPSLATVATSGLFTDLSSKPSGTAPLSYNSGTNSFNISQATTSTNGYLSSTDWNTFNNKYLLPSGGTTLQYVRGDGTVATFPTTLDSTRLIFTGKNTTGATLTKGTVVYVNGASGNLPLLAKALASQDSTSAQTLGLVQSDILNNQSGVVVLIGSITNIDTSLIIEGSQLYLSGTVAGGYTTTKYLAPTHLVYVGIVTRSHPTQGVIEVKIQNGYELDEIHDVQIISPADKDVLYRDSATSLWKHAGISTILGYTPYNGTNASIKALFSATTPLSYSDGVFSISQATTSSNGYLSSTDWNTFNGKTSLNGTGFVKATGTTISYDNTSYLPLNGGLMTGSIQFSDTTNLKRGIYGSMGTDDNWFVGANAGGVSQGYLEIATGDDGTEPIYATQYNGNAFTTGTVARRVTLLDGSGNSIFPNTLTATTLVKSGGTSSQFLKADGSVDSSIYLTTSSASSTYQTIITNPVTGTGTTNTIAYWTSASAIGSLALATYPSLTELSYVKGVTSAIQTQLDAKASTLSGTTNYHAKFTSSSAIGNSLIFDNGTNIGIGTASPNAQLHILGNTTSVFTSGLKINRSDQTGQFLTLNYEGGIVNFTAVDTAFSGPQFGFYTSTNGTSRTERMRIISAGVGIGTTSPDIYSRAYTTTLGISSSTGDTGIMINGGTSSGAYIDLGTAGTRNMGIISTTTESQVISLSTIPLVFKTNSVDRMRITSTGSIEIKIPATTTQGLMFVDSGLTQRGKLQYDDIAGSMIFGTMSGYPTILISNNIERMRILSNGNLCIGMTTSPYSAVSIKSNSANKYQGFAVYAPSNENFTYVNHDGNVGWIGADSTANGYVTPIAFATNNIERIRVHTNGNVTINTTSDPGYKLYVNGAIYATSNITANSDLTLKKNLKIIDNPIDKLMALNGYAYQWKSNDNHQYGVIAQEVEKILPYAVSTGNDGIKGVSYNQIIPVLIEAIKVQNKRIIELESKLA